MSENISYVEKYWVFFLFTTKLFQFIFCVHSDEAFGHLLSLEKSLSCNVSKDAQSNAFSLKVVVWELKSQTLQKEWSSLYVTFKDLSDILQLAWSYLLSLEWYEMIVDNLCFDPCEEQLWPNQLKFGQIEVSLGWRTAFLTQERRRATLLMSEVNHSSSWLLSKPIKSTQLT